ncbi:MAG: hypothetical protein AB8G15_13735 [Saprospiraceae bacterium]
MNNHYNFNINPKKLSKEKLEQHRDFDALLQKFQENPPTQPRVASYRWLKVVGATVAAASIALVIYFNLPHTEAIIPTSDAYFATQDFINPPFKHIQTPFSKYEVEANQGGVYKYKNGSQLIIPPAAFVNQQGGLVTGNVDVKYREFHDFVDFFLSGIPMEYDSANVRYHLESAGMMEIYAEQNGERLNMNPGKNIDVVLLSKINVPKGALTPPNYNIYKLDVAQRNWHYEGVDQIAFLSAQTSLPDEEAVRNAKQALSTQLKNLETQHAKALVALSTAMPLPSAPIKPLKAAGNNPFDLDFDVDAILPPPTPGEKTSITQERAHLKALKAKYGNVYWQLAPNSPSMDEQAKKMVWQDVKIKPLDQNNFELTLIHPSRTVKVMVNPVLKASDFEKEMNNYRSQYAAYEEALAIQKKQLEIQQAALQTKLATEKSALEQAFEEQLASFESDDATTPKFVNQKVVNKFKATSFGIWNCDRPVRPAAGQVNGSFVDDDKKTHQDRIAFLADKQKNTIARFYAQKDYQIHYNQDSENLLWLVTPDKKIAVFRPEKFKRINQGKDEVTFAVKVIEKEIKSEKDVREILQFELEE